MRPWSNALKYGLLCLAATPALLVGLALSRGNRPRCGPPSFACSRTDLGITQPDAAPLINFGGAKGANLVFQDPLYNNVQIARCTDESTNPAHSNVSYTVGLGGAGDKTSWNANDTLLQLTDSSGTPLIFRFDPSKMACRPICADGSDDLHCSGNSLYLTWPGVFSKVDPGKYFIFLTRRPLVKSITIGTSGVPTAPVTVADFSPALYKGRNPAWSPKTPIQIGDVIQPKRNNGPGLALFQAATAGVTGVNEPQWESAVEPYRGTNRTILPLPAWTGTRRAVAVGTKIQPIIERNAGKYIFKLTASGISGSAKPVWCQVPGCVTTDREGSWTNVGASSRIADGGVNWIKVGRTEAETWTSIGGVENRDHVFAMGISYSKPESAQDTGVWALAYDSVSNTIYQLNTYTKIETDYVCKDGQGYNCAGGAWKRTTPRAIPSSDSITVHNTTLAFDGTTLDIVCGAGAGPCREGIHKLWHLGTASWGEVVADGDGHSWIGNSHFVNQGAGAGADASSQKYLTIRANNNVGAHSPFWRVSPCTDISVGQLPYPSPPCYPQFDQHLSWVYNLGKDQEPAIGATFVTGNRYPAISPWQYEIIGVPSCGHSGGPACPAGYPSDTVWRFGRTFNFTYRPGGENFSALASIGALSQTGRFYALTSMGLGTMGTSRGANQCHQGFAWAKDFQYSNTSQITPYTNNRANYTFSAHCEGACKSGMTEPVWPQDGTTTVSDNQITWTPLGVANCRSDVLIYKLQ